MAADALVLSGIDAYYGDSHVLQKVSLRLGEGRLLGLLGRNGAGKTTCMNVVVGLLPPRLGAVTLFGEAVAGRSPEVIARRGMALVPQGRRIFRSLSVRENLIVAARKPLADARHPWTLDTVFASFPRLAERQHQTAGLSLGRRAADAGHRPRADVEPARSADGRAVRGARAADRRRGDGDRAQAQGAGPFHRPRRAELPSWCSTSPTISSSSTAAVSLSPTPLRG